MLTQDTPLARKGAVRVALSIVVPCYNEQESIPRLASSLATVRRVLESDYELDFVLVDDGSDDATHETLRSHFSHGISARVVRHEQNRGVAAAMLTGFRASDASLVCTLDCDGTYDPVQIQAMLDCLRDDVDVVTASPYHADGSVGAVPFWRLAVSKSASFLYRSVFRHRLATYTSCFRIYRREALRDLQLTNPGFVGVTEILWRLDQSGYRIVECPARLEARQFGRSKLRLARAAWQHFRFLSYAWWQHVNSYE
jgi:glycosyltransferase involved in cell wall biosynthesis